MADWRMNPRNSLGAESGASLRGGDRRRAVIDIGSNSVRLVVYEGPARAPFPICNEKALCGLGRDMGESRLLREGAVDAALATLRRFRRLLDDFGRPPVSAVATAAVRSARNGEDFVARARSIGFEIDVLSGEREAELAALGVASLEPGASGLVGDMGGGSLELTRLRDGAPSGAASLSIGPLVLMQRFPGDAAAAEAAIEKKLAEKGPWRDGERDKTLYAVGGAWRAAARIHMAWRDHPLAILHHYELEARDAMDVCAFIAQQSRQSLEDIPGVPRRRIETLPYAALVLKSVIALSGVKKVTVSAGGVREGLLYERLSASERRIDPLIAGAQHYGRILSPDPAAGAAACAVADPAFAGETAPHHRLRGAAFALMDVGAYFHPDLRARHAFDTALRAPFYNIAHNERAALASALLIRHEGDKDLPLDPVIDLLTEEDHQWAVRVGLAMRFLGSFAPKTPRAFAGCRLERSGERLTFRAPAGSAILFGETQKRRLDALAAAFGVESETAFTD